jgi:hypothetical protein
MSSVREPAVNLVSDPTSWQALWHNVIPAGRAPSLDFSRQAALAYFPGRSNSLEGFGFKSYQLSRSGAIATFKSGATDVMSFFRDQPFVIIVIPKTKVPISVKEYHVQGMGVPPISVRIIARINPTATK